MTFAEKAGLNFIEKFEHCRIYVNVMEQEKAALQKFLAYAICYLVFKSRNKISSLDFEEKLKILPELSSFYDEHGNYKDGEGNWEE